MQRGAVGILEDGGEDRAEEEGARAPEGGVDSARVAHVEVEELHPVPRKKSFLIIATVSYTPQLTIPAGGLEGAVHVPEVLAVHQGEGGAVRQSLGEVLGDVVRRRDVLVEDERGVLGCTDILHLRQTKHSL